MCLCCARLSEFHEVMESLPGTESRPLRLTFLGGLRPVAGMRLSSADYSARGIGGAMSRTRSHGLRFFLSMLAVAVVLTGCPATGIVTIKDPALDSLILAELGEPL